MNERRGDDLPESGDGAGGAATAVLDPPAGQVEESPPPRWRYWPPIAIVATGVALYAFWKISQVLPPIGYGYFARPPVYGVLIPIWDRLALTVIPAGVLLAGVGWMITSWRRLPTWVALALVMVAGVATATTVNLVRGEVGDLTKGIATGPKSPYYTSDLHFVYELGVREFVERHPELSEQFHSYNSRTHPAGVFVFLYLLFRIFGASHSLRIAAAIAVVAFASAISAWLIGRTLGGERAGRIGAVLFAAAPGPLMLAYSNLDTVFAVPMTLSVALFVLAAHRRSVTVAAAAGAVLGLGTLMTFATSFIVLAATIALVVQTGWRTAARLLAAAAAGGVAVLVLAWLTLGFDVLASYQVSPKVSTPYKWYWLLGSPAAWLIYAGLPLAALGIYGLFRKVPGAGRPVLVTVLVLFLVVWAGLPTELTKLRPGEVERTWMFLYPMAAATAGLVVDRWTAGFDRRWLRGAVVAGLVLLSVGQAVFIQGLYNNFF
ncbi:Dolichyl-phosphate-mannose-protein mannosyltransferase [Micromonospora rhizosphaerae]|uniref:Dolichyl-phosphate-mannose-protein mannosyltransferase n=1 Tax=Micromonospora rhizosphaerae TaxID=568872 RepID=A0A1C6S355_9ACTN|nr:glycosyltransferase family 39 protein [Micromonospora rhizosphaerae]SCL23861.1 Dolichyl-phosphate-mannose-protein mannosyltransferase [Micromonospora rhizosphaerae]